MKATSCLCNRSESRERTDKMTIVFLHQGENELIRQMLRALGERLAPHEVVSWAAGEKPPTQGMDVLLTSSSVDREQMKAFPSLSLIQTVSTGYESVDIEAATELGIWVSYAPSDITGNAVSVAEFAVLLMLGASRQIRAVVESLSGNELVMPNLHPVLNGKTVCIVGLGGVGRLVVDRLRPFGMLLLATDEHPENAPADVTAFPADQLLVAIADADYVVMCVRASKENDGLISAHVLAGMKRGAVLVNVARGSLLDEEALILALQDGQVSAAGLDVVRHEPLAAGDPLVKLHQVLLTPHVAAFTDLMLSGTVDFVCGVIRDFEAGRKLASILNAPQNPRRTLNA